MKKNPRALLLILICGALLGLLGPATVLAQPGDAVLKDRVEDLLRQLNDNQAERRDEAEQELLELAPTEDREASDAFLQLLPEPIEGMPEEVRLRLSRIRSLIENRQAKQALAPSQLSLDGESQELEEMIEEVQKQTGNRLVDYREQFGQDSKLIDLKVDIEDEAFWPALDKILDAAELSLYPFSGKDGLAVVNREEGAAPRSGSASYAGPFRVQAVGVVAQQDLRVPSQQGARVKLEIAWEPRLQPIALSQPSDSLTVIADDGSEIGLANPQASLDVEVQPGNHATELMIPLELPPRNVSVLETFKGELSALVPGRIVEFQFTELDNPSSLQQQRGGVKVELSGVRKTQTLWEIHMRLKVESEEAGLESHRGWVFRNTTYLLNENDEVVDHVGFETTMQSEREVGLAYYFELPEGEIGDYTWVYRTPAAIVRTPIKYELNDIPLP